MEKKETTYLFELISEFRTEIMALAAILILIFHVWIPVLPDHGRIGLLEQFIKRISFFGVDMFLFLSGMGLVFSRNASSLPVFYYKRLKKLLFPFLLSAGLHAFAEGWSKRKLFYAVTCIGFYKESIYYFLWFVPAILTLYLLFPLYYAFIKRAGNKVFFTLSALEIWLLLSLLGMSGWLRGDFYGVTNRIPVFLLGILLGCAGAAKKKIPISVPLCFVTFALGIYLSYQTNYKGLFLLVPVSNCCIPNLLMGISLCILTGLFLQLIRRFRIVGKCLKALGAASFELYCIQELVAEQNTQFLLARFSPAITNIILFGVIIVLALLTARLNRMIQKPLDALLLRKKKALTAK